MYVKSERSEFGSAFVRSVACCLTQVCMLFGRDCTFDVCFLYLIISMHFRRVAVTRNWYFANKHSVNILKLIFITKFTGSGER